MRPYNMSQHQILLQLCLDAMWASVIKALMSAILDEITQKCSSFLRGINAATPSCDTITSDKKKIWLFSPAVGFSANVMRHYISLPRCSSKALVHIETCLFLNALCRSSGWMMPRPASSSAAGTRSTEPLLWVLLLEISPGRQKNKCL